MTRKSGGLRANTRKKFSKSPSEKFTITPYLQEFKPNDKVVITIDPASQKGMPHHRFKGLIGEIKEKRGQSFVVNVKFVTKTKQVIARPEHLRLHTGK
ncbi:MAG: 50S ribosomal protein L21e [Candidatus Aenigmarchaeota archaeon]|nr:50S ribosomal protein L21e [Candidatus Aenigmarchaeota archaeon]